MKYSSTIVAPASPNGTGALSILRVSGNKAHEIVGKCIKEKTKFENSTENKIVRYTFINSKNKSFIDEITAIKYENPKSYTGENMVEIMCHGSKLVVSAIIENLKNEGAVLAKRGEFTQRAFINGKMDLIKAENIKNLIECNSNIQKRINENIHNKKHESILKNWIEIINEVLVLIESEIEFNEDVEIKKNEDESNKGKINGIKKSIKDEIEKWKKIEIYQEGIKIVIAGPPNAGKSSIFNKLLGYNRAIVTEIPGTTRDTISEKVIIDNNEITIIDSAGIRETDQIIEKIGIERSKKEIEVAHIVIWVVGIDQDYVEPEKEIDYKVIRIINKIDLDNGKKVINKDKNILMSIEKDINTDCLMNRIIEKIREISVQEIPEIVTNQRQLQIAENIEKTIDEVIEVWEEKEKAAYYLYEILDEFEEYFGKRDKENIYIKIFENYCIGK